MLTIPATIQTLFKTDGTRKNFRVHFPNGEYSDITNDNIVRESVHFTESLCSQDVFKFGLAEASVIEFETVGIGNMYGMTIECAYEIDTSSLSAAQITAIQSDPGDGTLVLSSVSDIGYGFYRVPLGTFRVESCPRNHGAMTHRKVTAYSYGFGALTPMSPYEAWRFSLWDSSGRFRRFGAKNFIYSNLGYYNQSILSDHGFTRTLYKDWSQFYQSGIGESVSFSTTDGHSGDFYPFGSTLTRRSYLFTNAPDSLYSIDLGNSDFSSLYSFITDAIQTYKIDTGGLAVDDYVAAKLYSLFPSFVFGGNPSGQPSSNIIIKESIPVFYPFSETGTTRFYRDGIGFDCPEQFRLAIRIEGVSQESTSFSVGSQPPAIYSLTTNESTSLDSVKFQAESTSQINQFYGFYDSFSLIDVLQGFMEVAGCFVKPRRNGGNTETRLDPSSPISIIPGNYEDCWWDEYDVSPIGSVSVSYLDGNGGEVISVINIGQGRSIYDMTDNPLLKSLSLASISDVEALLSGDFATNAANAGFTPVDLVMQGWPWMEAGDALEITAEDGTVVDTYALRIEMSGIQHLTAAIQSQGGEIIGEV